MREAIAWAATTGALAALTGVTAAAWWNSPTGFGKAILAAILAAAAFIAYAQTEARLANHGGAK